MNNLLISKNTLNQIKDYLNNPKIPLLMIGQKWLNKESIAESIAVQLLNIDASKLSNYPYYLKISSQTKNIGIDKIREINNFTKLKVPLKNNINRIILILNADNLSLEAQNALLKNIEEPPVQTQYILTAETGLNLLPTVKSRLNQIRITKPSYSEVQEYYLKNGYNQTQITNAYNISSGLPVLMEQIMSDEPNDINKAIQITKDILTKQLFEKMQLIETIKDRELFHWVIFITKQMANHGIKSKDNSNSVKWQNILKSTIKAEQELNSNVQLKLLLMNWVLNIS